MDIYNPFGKEKDRRTPDNKKLYALIGVGLALILVLSLVVILAKNDFSLTAALGGETVTQTETQTTVKEKIPSKESYYLFWINNEDNNALQYVWLARLITPSGALKVYSFSIQDLLQKDGFTYTMTNYYALFGAKDFADKVGETYDIKIGNYIGASDGMFKQTVNYLGGVTLDVKKPVNFSGDFNLILGKGSNSIKGELLYRYLMFIYISDDFDLTDGSEALIDIFNALFTDSNNSKRSSIFSRITNNMTSDIKIVTYQEKTEELDYLFENGISKATAVNSVDELKKG